MHNSPQRYRDEHLDPYSPVIAEDLLSGFNDWRNVQDIVRLTFKSLTDIIRTQSTAIRELERQMTSRLNKHEISNLLASKADTRFVSEQLAEVRALADSRGVIYEMQALLDEKVSRSEWNSVLSQKASLEEVRGMLDSKMSVRDGDSLAREVFEGLDSYKWSQLDRGVQDLHSEVRSKVTYEDLELVNRRNEERISKIQSISVNKSEFDNINSRKAEIGDIQRIMAALETKAEMAWVEQLSFVLEQKCDKTQLDDLARRVQTKLDRNEFDGKYTQINEMFNRFDYQSAEQLGNIGKDFDQFKDDYDIFKASTMNILGKKADQRDLDQAFVILNKKADNDRVGTAFEALKKEHYDHLSTIKVDIQQSHSHLGESLKSSRNQDESFRQDIAQQLQNLRDGIKNLNEGAKKNLEDACAFAKSLTNSLRREAKGDIGSLSEELEKAVRLLDEINSAKADRSELQDKTSRLSQRLDTKAEISQVDRLPEVFDNGIMQNSYEFKELLNQRLHDLHLEIFQALDKKIASHEFYNALNEKADVTYVNKIVSSKAQADDFSYLEQSLHALSEDLHSKASKQELSSYVSSTKHQLDYFTKDISGKININDITRLLDMKASNLQLDLDDFNSFVARMNNELEQRTLIDEFSAHVDEEAVVIEALCTENTTARWIWKSGDLKVGQTVPWEIQTINTCPDNFIWDRDATGILVVTAGLYELTFGFYSRKKPTVQVLVNGEAVLSAIDNTSNVVIHGYGELGQGSITGLTLVEFITLPPRSRVSLSYNGDAAGEGFFGLRKIQQCY